MGVPVREMHARAFWVTKTSHTIQYYTLQQRALLQDPSKMADYTMDVA
jgi:hypothetical protein